MSSLPLWLKGFSLFSIATGTADVFTGASGVASLSGHPLPVDSPAMVLADSQLRFLGGMWGGWGAMLWWVSNDLDTRAEPLAILGAVMVFCGVGRLISAVKHGFGSNSIAVAAAVEVLVPPAVWLFGGWS